MNTAADRADQCLSLFRAGRDTVQIATELCIKEPQASRLLWIARCRAKGLPAGYRDQRGILKQVAP